MIKIIGLVLDKECASRSKIDTIAAMRRWHYLYLNATKVTDAVPSVPASCAWM